MSANNECSQHSSVVNSHDDPRGFPVERARAVDSPLGQLDPSRITHMVVDQVGLNTSGERCSDSSFVVPGPPQQHWTCSSPAPSPIMPSPSRAMDGCGQMQRMGTPTNAMHMQQGTISSPSIGSAPMTPQHMVQQQQQAMVQGQQTPTGQFDHNGGFTQQQQGYPHGVPESTGVQADNSSGVVYTRPQMMIGQQQQMVSLQQQQQQMMGQQQPIIGQQVMLPHQMGMMGASPQYYAQQNPQAQWTQQQQHMQQGHFVRQPQMAGATVGQRVMVQRVPYPPGTGYPAVMQTTPQQQPQVVVTQQSSRPSGAPSQQAQRPTYPPGTTSQPAQYAYPSGQAAGFQQQQQAAQVAAYQQQMYQRQQQVSQHQQMRPYMSPQGAMVTPTHQTDLQAVEAVVRFFD
ncbi:hypothetical protein RB195_002097 [Necator americanus]|uniref:Uncharacterized protein n=1 Tax=Necator americanus TaxID=51031 RepID=A0ABR1DHC0_NECAM